MLQLGYKLAMDRCAVCQRLKLIQVFSEQNCAGELKTLNAPINLRVTNGEAISHHSKSVNKVNSPAFLDNSNDY